MFHLEAQGARGAVRCGRGEMSGDGARVPDSLSPRVSGLPMRIYFDTEFIEDGHAVDLISIGLAREDGNVLYLESAEVDLSRASDWIQLNVIPHLRGGFCRMGREAMREEILKFCGRNPEFWAFYADYDWWALCQLFGRMNNLPQGWPLYCRDLKQEADRLGASLPGRIASRQHALADAVWVRDCAISEIDRLQVAHAAGFVPHSVGVKRQRPGYDFPCARHTGPKGPCNARNCRC